MPVVLCTMRQLSHFCIDSLVIFAPKTPDVQALK